MEIKNDEVIESTLLYFISYSSIMIILLFVIIVLLISSSSPSPHLLLLISFSSSPHLLLLISSSSSSHPPILLISYLFSSRLLIKCQLYNNQKEDAIKTGSSAIHIARKHVPTQLIPTFRQLVCET